CSRCAFASCRFARILTGCSSASKTYAPPRPRLWLKTCRPLVTLRYCARQRPIWDPGGDRLGEGACLEECEIRQPAGLFSTPRRGVNGFEATRLEIFPILWGACEKNVARKSFTPVAGL